jgi:aarF domain-containing kinase
MTGKRLLDLAALFNASRGVAQKHFALRERQLDVYNRTSTVARAIRNQTDRVTETAKAASFLASRLNESAPSWASEATDENPNSQSKDGGPPMASNNGSTKGDATSTRRKEGLEQNQVYESTSSTLEYDETQRRESEIKQETNPRKESEVETVVLNTSSNPTPILKSLSEDTARLTQRKYEQQTPSRTADGLGNSAWDPLNEGRDEDSFYRRSGHTSPSLSSLPRMKIPKHTSRSQEIDKKHGLNSDLFYGVGGLAESMKVQPVQGVPDQEEVPEGVNTNLFHSPRVAKILGGKTQQDIQNDLKLSGTEDTPVNGTSSSAGTDQDTVNIRTKSFSSSSDIPTISKLDEPPTITKGKEDFTDLVQEITQKGGEYIKAGTEILNSQPVPYELRESRVPSSRLGRLWSYGGLAAGMFGGAVSESIRRVSGGGEAGSLLLSAGNMDRLVTKLSRMRGAALKLGQMISFQDSKLLAGPVQEVLQRVQDRADYMPASQRNKVLASNLGSEWRDLFSSFEEKPLAAASIGQVHSAILKSNGARVAVKIQYPGVADSIDSDLSNLAVLLTASRLLPKGLFLDKTIANARIELGWECDYIREAECGRRFETLLANDTDVFVVPKVFPEASGKQVLTMEYMDGIGVTRVQSFTQEQKDWIGTQLLRLCLREITEFRYMQTDPNWTNFLYNAKTNKLELLDFGASREYPAEFITTYSKLLVAASKSDRKTVRILSKELGYLTGKESKAMNDAHIRSVLTLAEPFLDSSPEVYDFRDQTITDRVKALIPVMMKERLVPPPEETYSLHRKLSGAFLLCARLGSRVRCRDLFASSMEKAGLL